MAGQPGCFDGDDRLKALSAAGDPLERLARGIDFELFRADLEAALARSDRAKGGRPPYDPVRMFKVLVVQTLYPLSDDQTAYRLKGRLSFMRFVGLALHDPVPRPRRSGSIANSWHGPVWSSGCSRASTHSCGRGAGWQGAGKLSTRQ
jgi:hypothetical protein